MLQEKQDENVKIVALKSNIIWHFIKIGFALLGWPAVGLDYPEETTIVRSHFGKKEIWKGPGVGLLLPWQYKAPLTAMGQDLTVAIAGLTKEIAIDTSISCLNRGYNIIVTGATLHIKVTDHAQMESELKGEFNASEYKKIAVRKIQEVFAPKSDTTPPNIETLRQPTIKEINEGLSKGPNNSTASLDGIIYYYDSGKGFAWGVTIDGDYDFDEKTKTDLRNYDSLQIKENEAGLEGKKYQGIKEAVSEELSQNGKDVFFANLALGGKAEVNKHEIKKWK